MQLSRRTLKKILVVFWATDKLVSTFNMIGGRPIYSFSKIDNFSILWRIFMWKNVIFRDFPKGFSKFFSAHALFTAFWVKVRLESYNSSQLVFWAPFLAPKEGFLDVTNSTKKTSSFGAFGRPCWTAILKGTCLSTHWDFFHHPGRSEAGLYLQ